MKRSLQLILTLYLLGSAAYAGKVSPDFRVNNPQSLVTVIVQFTTPPTPSTLGFLNGKGAAKQKVFKQFPTTMVLTVPQFRVAEIAEIPTVKYVSPDRPVVKHLDITAATVGSSIANSLGFTGAGIGVAVLDSGIDASNADLNQAGKATSRVVYAQDFVGTGTMDFYGHGTHVAGIIAGNGANSNGRYRGIAPQANLINMRVLDENGRSE